MTRETLIWMLLSSWITAHIFFVLNDDGKTYFGTLPQWTGGIILYGYFGIMLLYGLNYIREEKLKKQQENLTGK